MAMEGFPAHMTQTMSDLAPPVAHHEMLMAWKGPRLLSNPFQMVLSDFALVKEQANIA